MAPTVGVRRSIQEIVADYHNGNRRPLDDLIRAWRGIQALGPNDWNSFFMIGGFHGEPFQIRDGIGAPPNQDETVDSTDPNRYVYWGGWCNHGNVLFPTWHRVYLHRLEQALQSIVPGVMLPYWDETSLDSLKGGVPDIFHQQTYELDGQQIHNPLYSFMLPRGLSDILPTDTAFVGVNEYKKPAGYTTVRYPLSGLVGTPEAQQETATHNRQFLDPQKNAQLLDQNVIAWLKGTGSTPPDHDLPGGAGPTSKDPDPQGDGVYWMYKTCLDAPNYTVFSNTTSAGEWNKQHKGWIVPLEQPHNDIHLAIGGFDIPGQEESGQITGANGDMGENNTAALDPIFFFHHCNVDRMFWVWQKKHGCTDKLDVISDYPGTSASDSQGPTPDFFPGDSLNLNSPLSPFKKTDGAPFTSNDAVNIETQLGYTYSIGSLDAEAVSVSAVNPAVMSVKKVSVAGIDRSLFRGSFVIRAYAKVEGCDGHEKTYYLGHHSVLSRGNTLRCANCLTHLEVQAYFPLTNVPPEERDAAECRIAIQHRGRHVVLPAMGFGAPRIVKSTDLPQGLNVTIAVKE